MHLHIKFCAIKWQPMGQIWKINYLYLGKTHMYFNSRDSVTDYIIMNSSFAFLWASIKYLGLFDMIVGVLETV